MKRTSTLNIVIPLFALADRLNTDWQRVQWKSICICLIASFGVLFSLDVSAQSPSIDLSVRKVISNSRPQLNDVVSYTLVTRNSGNAGATNVTVKDQLPAGGVQFVSSNILRGNNAFNSSTGIWTIGSLAANDSAILVINVRVLNRGVWFNTAEVMTASQADIDSQPGNGILTEDDFASVCFSVPVFWYPGDEFTIAIPSGYSAIKWYRNGQQVGTAAVAANLAVVNPDSSLLIRSPGTYSFQTTRNGCVSGNCCDIEIIQGPYGSIGDFVFNDLNQNGLQDDGANSGVAGVQVALYTATGTNPLRTVLTDANGNYKFDSLMSGTYRVRFIAPSGQQFTLQTAGSNRAIDSDPGTDGFTALITIDAEQPVGNIARNNNTIDAGIRPVVGPCVIESPPIACVVPNICVGTSTQLTAIGCANGTIRWSDGQTGSSITVAPQVTTTYSASCVVGNCVSNSSNLIVVKVVNPQPPTVVASATTICAGDSVRLTALGCEGGSIQWSEGGQIGSSILVRPLVNTTYTAICRQANCLSTPTTIVINVGANLPRPTICKGCTPTSICPGEEVTLKVYGCEGTPVWSNGQTTSSIVVAPTVGNNTFWVECRRGNCVSPRSEPITIDVINPVVPTIAVNSSTICVGGTASLTATGCSGIVTWSNGMTGSVINVQLNASQTFSAQCVIGNCLSNPSTGVTVNVVTPEAPTIAVQGSTLVCAGDVVNLSTTSSCPGGTIVWSNGATGSSISVVASSTQEIFAYCQIGSCKSAESNRIRINVNNIGTAPTITASSLTVCAGSSVTLTAANCTGTVVWSNGQSGASIVVTPTALQNQFSAVCRSGNCGSPQSNVVQITVVNPGTPPTITASSLSVCAGNSVTLTAANCTGTVVWSNGQSGASIVVVPTPQQNQFSAICRVATCNSPSSNTVTINVNNTAVTTPTVTASSLTVCTGSSVTLTAANCSGTVVWSNGQSGASIVVTPTLQQNQFSAICRVATCSSPSSNTVQITVVPELPKPTVVCSATQVCPGEELTLTVVGCIGTPIWSTGQTTSSITVVPVPGNNTYSVVCRQGSCTSPRSDNYTIDIANPIVPAIAASSGTICVGGTVSLTALGCQGAVSWSNGQTGNVINVTLTSNQTFYAQCKVGNCLSNPSNVVTVNVVNPSTPTITVKGSTQVCAGDVVALSTSSSCPGGSIVWSNGATGSSINLVASVTQEVYAVCRVGSCESARSNKVTINVNSAGTPPTVTASSLTVCNGGTVTLTAANCTGTVVWSNGQTGSVITVSPTPTQNQFSAICRVGTSCGTPPSNTVQITVTTRPRPEVICSTESICLGQQLTLVAKNCDGIPVWNTGQTTSHIVVSPTVTTTYNVVCKNGDCVSDRSLDFKLSVTQAPKPTIAASSTLVTPGSSVTLSATNCPGTVSWSNGMTGASIVVPLQIDQSFIAFCRVKDCLGQASNSITVAVRGSGTQPQNQSATIGVAMALVSRQQQGDNTFNLRYRITVQNFGSVGLTAVQLMNDLTNTFAAPTSFTVTGPPTVRSGSNLVVNPAFTGRPTAGTEILLNTSKLNAGERDSVFINVRVVLGANKGPFYSSVLATGYTPSPVALVQDQSNNGFDPTPAGSVMTPVRFDLPVAMIGVAKAVSKPVAVVGSPGVYDLSYTIKVTNLGNETLNNVQVSDNLAQNYGAGVTIVSSPISVSTDAGFTGNTGFTGQGLLIDMLNSGQSTLPVGATRTIWFKVRVNISKSTQSTLKNTAIAVAQTAGGVAVRDTSTAGLDADPDNDLDPRNNSQPTQIVLSGSPQDGQLGLAMAVKDTVRQANGSYNVTYQVVVKNYGSVDLTNVQVTDSLTKVFNSQSGASYTVVGPPQVSSSSKLIANSGFNGNSDARLVIGDSLSMLAVGQADTILFTINVVTNGRSNTFLNTAYGEALAGSLTVTDVSTDGVNPDPDGNGNPSDVAESESTPLSLNASDVNTAFFIPAGFSPNGDGINDTFVIQGTQGLTVSLEVYNRWGHLVYKSDDYKNDWNGTSNTGVQVGNSTGTLPDGTYYYVVRLSDGRDFVKYLTINR